ncbi:hypothetical protein NDN08_003743 [Rhodosorus marinus]|uniref:DUF7482 domain-containing protein n=1 Tax=Rhodosorus marinus TaxID=101924 RepID=A0AAV8UGC9_9RHOD|nr:hypothetical protein NDN08_003743 [Rhodosorus marinus]
MAKLVSLVVLLFAASLNFAKADDDVQPAPPSIGADVPLTYFGPPPSSVQKELIGPHQLLRSGTVDLDAGTVTLPLYEGYYEDGSKHYYILTDTTDRGNGEALGLNVAPKLSYAHGRAVDDVYLDGFKIRNRTGKVDFRPARSVVPGDEPNPFPPKRARPGAIGDKNYTPLIRLVNTDRSLYNAPIVADGVNFLNDYCNGISGRQAKKAYKYIHDTVIAICPEEQTVTLNLASGFSFARPVFYISTDANDMTVAALEASTFAPGLDAVVVGGDDSAFSAVERIFVTINGPSNAQLPRSSNFDHPQRQGIESALRGEGGPLNVLGGIPTIATDYSPLWDMNLGEWTKKAIKLGIRTRVLEEFQILGLVLDGFITGPNGDEYGSVGIIINCPIVQRLL